MADRRVKLILEAQTDQFQRGIDGAKQSVEGLKNSTEQVSKSGGTKDIGREWTRVSRTMQGDMRTVGTGFAAVGGSILGVYGSLVSTGIEYNTLQQVAGRSLETVMGSASAAADQMERLHEFADTSPFSRQTWIHAQMQLSAFGMEAGRIVPTLDAIQNAVAAIGGGDAEIMRIVDILGTVQGQGRITATELNRLGSMGIDAAEMIGAAMGVSGDEIRTQITAGALDAETAIEALTTGMMMRFDGAAEGMRDTMTGAWDRIKAAWRDLGSILAAPLVDPEGGGSLVWLTNAAADAIRALEGLPDPVLQSVGAMSGIAGVAMAGYGAMMLLVPQVVAFRDAKARLAAEMPKTSTAMRRLGTAATIAAAGFVALSVLDSVWDSFMRIGPRDIDEITRSLEGFERTGSYAGGVQHFGDALNALDETGNKVKANAPGWASTLMTAFNPAGGVDFALTQSLAEELEATDAALSGMLAAGNFDAVAANVENMAQQFIEADRPLSKMRTDFPELDAELAKVGISFDEMLVAVGASKGVYDEANGTYKNTEITLSQLASRMTGIDEAALDAADGSVELAAALEEVGLSADGTISSLETFLDLLYQAGLLTMSARDAQSAYESQLDATKASIDELNDEASEMGRILNDNKTDFDLTTEAGRLAQDQFHGVARSGMDLTQALAENGATQDEVQGALRRTYDDLIRAGQGMGMTKVDAEALTREILQIPDEQTIDTWLESTAEDQVKSLQRELDRVDGRRTTSSHTHTIHQNTVRSMTNRGIDPNLNNVMMATGGAVIGPGTGTSDDIAAWLSNGEHVLTARDVQAMGGQRGVYNFRETLHNPRPPAREMMPAYSVGGAVPRAGGGGVATGQSSPAGFTGNLYLSTGEFVGIIRGAMKDPGVVQATSEGLASHEFDRRRA